MVDPEKYTTSVGFSLQKGFCEVVMRILSDPILHIPNFSLRFVLNIDASHNATEAVLCQKPADLNHQK